MNKQNSVMVFNAPPKRMLNQRKKTYLLLSTTLLFLIVIVLLGFLLSDVAALSDFTQKNLPPSLKHPFGTDWLGRDMLARTLSGLSISILIGIVAAAASSTIAIILAAAAATLGKGVDAAVSLLIDVVLSIPHILLLLLISFALGKGLYGITIALAVSHWPALTRILRIEIIQLREALYIRTAQKLGQSPLSIVKRHMLPHIFPQLFVGFVLLFPHAILHEAGLTFLGFGLPPELPAIGIILSESLKYLSLGMWWLSFLPGFGLLLTVILFDQMGTCIRKIIDPFSSQE